MPNAKPHLVAATVASACLLALSACGSPTEPSAVTTETATATAAATATATQVGDCFDIGTSYFAIANRWVVDSPAIPCTPGSYNLQTIALYDVPAELAVTIPELDKARAESDNLPDDATVPQDLQDLLDEAGTVLDPVNSQCWQDFNDLVDRQTVDDITRTDMLMPYLFGPNEQEWADGDRSMRCAVMMVLSIDSTRTDFTLLPLPADLEGAANIFSTQLCSDGEGDSLVVLACDDPDLPNDAWLSLSLATPMSVLGPFPGKDKGFDVLFDRCTSFASHFVKPDAELTEENTMGQVYLPSGEDVSDWSPKQMWDEPDMLFLCKMHKGLFADAS